MRKLILLLVALPILFFSIIYVLIEGPKISQNTALGKTWVSSMLANISLKKQIEKYTTPGGHSTAIQLKINNYSQFAGTATFASESFLWPLPFTRQYVPNVVVPLRFTDAGELLSKQAKPEAQKKFQSPIVAREITNPLALALEFEKYERTITVVNNKEMLLPYRNLDTLTFASLSIGQPQGNYFQNYLSKYAPFQHYAIASKDTSARAFDALISKLEKYKIVIIGLHDVNQSALQAYGIPQSSRTFIERLRSKTNVTLVVFGTPYSLKYFDRVDHLLCAYEDNSVTQKLVPQVLFGAVGTSGRLPVTVNENLKAGFGITTPSLKRLGYTIPERVGLQTATLQRIDKIVEGCILDSVMPGCQILVAKNGKVIFEKAYGHLTYDKKEPVTTNTLYDLASVTKVAATLQAVMALQAKNVIDINKKASFYLSELKNTNKENILVRDLLLHQAGLIAFQDHWTRTKVEANLDTAFYSITPDEHHPLMVAQGIYGIAALKDSLWRWTIQSRLLKKPVSQKTYKYKYSDVGFDILQQLVERLVDEPMDIYLSKTFYKPLGLDALTFNPLKKFDAGQIAPTELDNRFRGMLVRGTVHDQEAALMGGVAGHAGLFGTASDLATLMQMNLQNGYYGGRQFIGENTIPVFTKTYQTNNPRGLGWDRPAPDGGGSVSELASRNSFGHTGFTGTCVWIDPDQELVYIFLSNRVYPNVDNTKLARYKVRQKIQNVVYQAFINDELTAGISK